MLVDSKQKPVSVCFSVRFVPVVNKTLSKTIVTFGGLWHTSKAKATTQRMPTVRVMQQRSHGHLDSVYVPAETQRL